MVSIKHEADGKGRLKPQPKIFVPASRNPLLNGGKGSHFEAELSARVQHKILRAAVLAVFSVKSVDESIDWIGYPVSGTPAGRNLSGPATGGGAKLAPG